LKVVVRDDPNSASGVVAFWDHGCENGFLSNLFPAPIVIDGVTWATSEHYYQAMKHEDPVIIENIRSQEKAIKSKFVSREYCKKLNRWPTNAHKLKTMRIAINAKFDQHPVLKELLVSTWPVRISEASTQDPYWGVGADGTGEDMMGQLLMERRALYLADG
jgi:ribA/ribD-fused uncharacterized protein